MSGHSLSAIFLFIAVAAIAMATHIADLRKQERRPASVKKEQLTTAPPFKHTEKLRGPLNAMIELIGAHPIAAGDVFVLRGLIHSTKDLQDVEFKWSIPAGLEVVNGTVAGTISILKSNQPTEVQITLRALGPENRQVHLITNAADRGARFADSAQYNTVLQAKIDQRLKAMRASTERAGFRAKSLRKSGAKPGPQPADSNRHGLKIYE